MTRRSRWLTLAPALVLVTMAFAPGSRRALGPGCVLKYGDGHCAGMLPKGFETASGAVALVDAALREATADGTLHGHETERKVKETCTAADRPCQFARPLYNRDSRNFDLAKLGDDPVVVGGIRWKKGVPFSDTLYKAGRDIPDDNFNARTTAFVVYKAAPDATHPNRVGTWKLIGFARPSKLVVLSQGSVDVCEKSHDSQGPYAGFLGCLRLKLVHEFAQRNNIPAADVFDALNCEVAVVKRTGASLSGQCGSQRRSKLKSLVAARRGAAPALMKELEKALDAESDDAYWFSCGAGCCIASI